MRSTKALATVTAILEAGTGAALLGLPSNTAGFLLGASLTSPAAVTVARVCGAGLLALGVERWLARPDTQSVAAHGLVVGILIYNFVVAGVLAFANLAYGLHGVALWPAIIAHLALGAWCIACLSTD